MKLVGLNTSEDHNEDLLDINEEVEVEIPNNDKMLTSRFTDGTLSNKSVIEAPDTPAPKCNIEQQVGQKIENGEDEILKEVKTVLGAYDHVEEETKNEDSQVQDSGELIQVAESKPDESEQNPEEELKQESCEESSENEKSKDIPELENNGENYKVEPENANPDNSKEEINETKIEEEPSILIPFKPEIEQCEEPADKKDEGVKKSNEVERNNNNNNENDETSEQNPPVDQVNDVIDELKTEKAEEKPEVESVPKGDLPKKMPGIHCPSTKPRMSVPTNGSYNHHHHHHHHHNHNMQLGPQYFPNHGGHHHPHSGGFQPPFGFPFNDGKFEVSWPQFPPPHLPPLPVPMGPSQPTPLPTALYPLPFDPNYLPAILPSLPPTSQSSGYSTAGHSRSSSPMAPVNIQGQPLIAIDGNNQMGNGNLLPPPVSSTGSGPNPSFILAAPSNELSGFPNFTTIPGQFMIYFHINPSVAVSFYVGADQFQIIKGPVTVPLLSTNSNPPIPLPLQVPQGHVVQQIVDENGTLRHVIVSHQPPLMPIPNYGPGNQPQPFYPPGPGYPGAHFANQMQGAVPCGIPSAQGPSTPPGQGNNIGPGAYVGHIQSHAHKDERAQRQYQKLRRKFEQKQQREREVVSTTFPTTHFPQNGNHRKVEPAYNNNSRRNVPNGPLKSSGGAEEEGSVGSTGSVTSTGTQDEEEETRVLAQTEMLASIIPPVVSDVTSRSAFVQWSHPDRFTESGENKFPEFDVPDTDFRYEVFISDKTRENRFKSIFVGSALSCRVKDLKPGSNYAISYCAMLNDVKGNTSVATNFTTLPAEPDAPNGPRAISRSRSSIQFKWSPPLYDNGGKISNYLLEYDEGKGGSHFVEAYKGKSKQCTVNKLQPAYSYQFRLAAINQCGQSKYSPVVTVMTAGSPPLQPSPPTMTEVGVTYLTLVWIRRPTDDEYTLQMEDPITGHGYLCVYNGSAPHYTCIALKRNTQYKFRVKAQNEEGHSKWSDDVVVQTLPDRPCPPHKPALKGRVHSNCFRVRWEPPADDGGVPITSYALQIDQGNGGFEEIYHGSDGEFNVDRLSPGQSYALRVIAIGPGGESDPSEICVITTEPVCPGKCHIPRTMGKPKSNSVHLKWSPPDWDGGSPVNQYEVGCTTPDNQTQEAYRGKETDCFINRLLPGRAYLFQIRAFNRIGAGPWSDPLEIVSGAGSPDAPGYPKVVNKAAHIVIVSWSEPLNNGAAITDYRVQMTSPAIPGELVREDAVEKAGEDEIPPTVPTSTFAQVWQGTGTNCEVKGLTPATTYLFRLQAVNSAGNSEWSPVTTHSMPASSPNAIGNLEGSSTSDSISLTWSVPYSNGAPVVHYNVMVGETVHVSQINSLTLDNLMPDSHYKIRVQGVNSVGPGPFSPLLKMSTKPLPPLPPKLECVSVAHYWMKLKWSEVTNKNIEYLVQMINPYQDEFQVVYRGNSPNCKVTRLIEDTEYQFRICSLNGAGQGPYSEMYRFSTLKAPPPQVKGFKVELLKDSKVHRFDWIEVTATSDTNYYQLQIAKRRDHEYKTVYKGEERKFDLCETELDEGIDYLARVCAIRLCNDGSQLIGPYSNQVNFQIPIPPKEDIMYSKGNNFASKSLSTTAQVKNNLFQAIEEKLQTVSYESRVGILAVFALIFLAFIISLITHHVVS